MIYEPDLSLSLLSQYDSNTRQMQSSTQLPHLPSLTQGMWHVPGRDRPLIFLISHWEQAVRDWIADQYSWGVWCSHSNSTQLTRVLTLQSKNIVLPVTLTLALWGGDQVRKGKLRRAELCDHLHITHSKWVRSVSLSPPKTGTWLTFCQQDKE